MVDTELDLGAYLWALTYLNIMIRGHTYLSAHLFENTYLEIRNICTCITCIFIYIYFRWQTIVAFCVCDPPQALTEGIEALPFFRLYRGGEIIESVQGAVPSALEQLILAHTLVVERL